MMASLIRLHQDRETPVQIVRGPSFACRYAYARSADTRKADDAGQDYLAFRQDDATFTFTLCDGVSQSFYGDLAARLLGEALLDWLWNHATPAEDRQALEWSLTSALESLTGPATEQVQQHAVPEGVPDMLRLVLEDKRARGSESTFACGRIDLPGPGVPEGRLVLAWMGDSRIRLWGPGVERTAELGGRFDIAQRWSSRRGAVNGGPNLFVAPLFGQGQRLVTRLLVYSDGLAALDRFSLPPSNATVQSLIDEAGEAPTSDDISFVEIWPGPVPAGVETVRLPAPQWLAAELMDDRIRASWRPVAGSTGYQVELRDGEAETWPTGALSWESSPLPPGTYRLRVRARRGDEPGTWSEPRHFEVLGPIPVEEPTVGAPAEPPSPWPETARVQPEPVPAWSEPAPIRTEARPAAAPPAAPKARRRPPPAHRANPIVWIAPLVVLLLAGSLFGGLMVRQQRMVEAERTPATAQAQIAAKQGTTVTEARGTARMATATSTAAVGQTRAAASVAATATADRQASATAEAYLAGKTATFVAIQATETAKRVGDATYAALATASAEAQQTAAAVIIPTGTLPPTDTPTPLPTATPTSPTPAPSPTNTSRPTTTATPTPTLTPTPYPPPKLTFPEDKAKAEKRQWFKWNWPYSPLPSDLGFQVLLWKAGSTEPLGAAEPVPGDQFEQEINLNYTDVLKQGGAGIYYWSVVVVECESGKCK